MVDVESVYDQRWGLVYLHVSVFDRISAGISGDDTGLGGGGDGDANDYDDAVVFIPDHEHDDSDVSDKVSANDKE